MRSIVVEKRYNVVESVPVDMIRSPNCPCQIIVNNRSKKIARVNTVFNPSLCAFAHVFRQDRIVDHFSLLSGGLDSERGQHRLPPVASGDIQYPLQDSTVNILPLIFMIGSTTRNPPLSDLRITLPFLNTANDPSHLMIATGIFLSLNHEYQNIQSPIFGNQ
jgi:hypothetical protein